MVSITPLPLYFRGEKRPIHVVQEAGWAQFELYGEEKNLLALPETEQALPNL
jgi:hypothetical protein